MRLEGKVAIVTGGGSGIGKAIARAFAAEGAQVVISGRTTQKLETAAAEMGSHCLAIAADVGDSASLSLLVRAAHERFEHIDILVNNAGVLLPGTVESMTEADWDHTFNINVRSIWRLARLILPYMRPAGGSIVNIGSVLGTVGARDRVAYAASKGAVLALTKAMALDHAAEKIRVNCICPGIVDTALVAPFSLDPNLRRQRESLHPLGRFGQPDDIAGLAVLLASDESAWITGSAFYVDGGFTAQ